MPLFLFIFDWHIQLFNININRRYPFRCLQRYFSEEWTPEECRDGNRTRACHTAGRRTTVLSELRRTLTELRRTLKEKLHGFNLPEILSALDMMSMRGLNSGRMGGLKLKPKRASTVMQLNNQWKCKRALLWIQNDFVIRLGRSRFGTYPLKFKLDQLNNWQLLV